MDVIRTRLEASLAANRGHRRGARRLMTTILLGFKRTRLVLNGLHRESPERHWVPLRMAKSFGLATALIGRLIIEFAFLNGSLTFYT